MPLRKDARPGDGHAVGADAEILEQAHVFLVAMVGVVGHVAGVSIEGFAGRVGVDVPDGWAAAIFVGSAFNLIGSGGAAPMKAVGKRTAEGMRVGEGETRQLDCGDGGCEGLAELVAGDAFHG